MRNTWIERSMRNTWREIHEEHLDREIQERADGHHPREDSLPALDLVKLKIRLANKKDKTMKIALIKIVVKILSRTRASQNAFSMFFFFKTFITVKEDFQVCTNQLFGRLCPEIDKL